MEINKIYNLDCVKGFLLLESQSIDCVWTDPPYNIEYAYDRYKDNMGLEAYKALMDHVFKECWRVLKPGKTMFMKQFYKNLPFIMEIGCRYFNFHNLIIWKNSSPAQPNDNFKPAYEVILMFTKGEINYFNPKFEVRKTIMPWNKKRAENYYGKLTNIWDDIPYIYGGSIKHKEGIFKPGTNQKAHPCQHPMQLVVRSIGFTTQEGDVILDPFIGSGTTAEACKQLGRKFIGFEISPEYCKIAEERLKQEVLTFE